MKKFTFIFLLNLIVSSALLAQVSVGIKAGGALANQVYKGIGLTSNGNSDNLKDAHLGGLFVSAPLSERFTLQPEVLYSNKGFQAGRYVPTRFHLHYVSLSVMLQAQLLDKLTVELGPEVGYLIDANASNLPISVSGSPSTYDQMLYSYKDLDLALNIGVGYSLFDRWNLNLRYNMGIADVLEDFTISVAGQDEPVLISGSTYNRSLQLSVGLRLF
uniref:Porin family protein n=1 Tax=Roseihalotalea indica TaxID=2867963 RepID=A0AA49GR16_9BACT|nr:porin family protein [Tunicatimonas sp. TK19036]